MNISIIAVVDKNNGIGKNNNLLCYLPADLKHFKTLTSGHTIVMGRKTFQSLPKGALPNRRNIVLSRDKSFMCEGCEIVSSRSELFKICKEDEKIFIIGGAQIYKLFINQADYLHLTHIDHEFEADTFFPEFNKEFWQIESKLQFAPDEKNKFSYSFVDYKRVNPLEQ